MLNAIRKHSLRVFSLSDNQEAVKKVFHLSANQENEFTAICEMAQIINDNAFSGVHVHNDFIHEILWATDYTVDYDLSEGTRYIAYGNMKDDYVWLAYTDSRPGNNYFKLLGLLFLGETDGISKFVHFVHFGDQMKETISEFFALEFGVSETVLWINASH